MTKNFFSISPDKYSHQMSISTYKHSVVRMKNQKLYLMANQWITPQVKGKKKQLNIKTHTSPLSVFQFNKFLFQNKLTSQAHYLHKVIWSRKTSVNEHHNFTSTLYKTQFIQ